METNFKIDANMSVREIMRRFPATRKVFDQYGLFGCGGEEGPTEPLSLFARVHQANVADLMEQLRQAAAGEEVATPPPARDSEPAARRGLALASADPRVLSRRFIRTAVLCLVTGGCLLGAIMLGMIARYGTFEMASYWPAWTLYVQAHAHVQLSGWIALFIMGVAYFALPRFLAVNLQEVRSAKVSYALMLAGILLRVFYQPFSSERWAANWVVWGTAAELLASILFLRVVLQTVRLSPKRAEPYTSYLRWGSAWFVVSQGILLVHAASALVHGEPVLLTRALDEAYLHVTLLGFVGLYILGVTLRTIPLLLDFQRQAGESLQRRVLLGWNLGIVLFAAGPLLARTELATAKVWALAGAALELLAGIAFLVAVNPLQKPQVPQPEDTPRAWLWLVRSAYLWFAVALGIQAVLTLWPVVTGIEPGHPYWGAFRHALTVGWISMMIFGMAYRMVPVMEGRAAAMAWTAPVVLGLANLGNIGRVALQSLTPTVPGAFAWMAPTGALELSAGILFAIAMWKTMGPATAKQEEISAARTQPESSASGLAVGPDTVVARVLSAYPASLEVFIRHGFTPLKNPILRATAARMVTVSQACRMHGINLDALLRDLNGLRQAASVAENERATLVQLNTASPAAEAEPKKTEEERRKLEEAVWSVLRQIEDPEFPGISLVDLGLVYEVAAPTAQNVRIHMTLTSHGCPAAKVITDTVRKRVEYKTSACCQVELVWEPPWTPDRITEQGKQLLGYS